MEISEERKKAITEWLETPERDYKCPFSVGIRNVGMMEDGEFCSRLFPKIKQYTRFVGQAYLLSPGLCRYPCPCTVHGEHYVANRVQKIIF